MSNLRYTRGSFLSTLYLTRPGASGKRGRGPRARGRAHVRKTSTPKPVPAVVGEWGGIARLPARHSRAWMPLSRLEALQAKHSRARTPLSRQEAFQLKHLRARTPLFHLEAFQMKQWRPCTPLSRPRVGARLRATYGRCPGVAIWLPGAPVSVWICGCREGGMGRPYSSYAGSLANRSSPARTTESSSARRGQGANCSGRPAR